MLVEIMFTFDRLRVIALAVGLGAPMRETIDVCAPLLRTFGHALSFRSQVNDLSHIRWKYSFHTSPRLSHDRDPTTPAAIRAHCAESEAEFCQNRPSSRNSFRDKMMCPIS